MEKNYLVVFLFVVCLKLLLIPTYHSTDMEVHRNWMAITHSRNISDWYSEATSQWTLDYPPLFAWFEYVLSFCASYFDPNMLDIEKLNYMSSNTLLFMRISVVVTDFVYIFAVKRIYDCLRGADFHHDDPWVKREVIFAMLMLWSPGLLIIDHIHFQYNGFLYGILFLSIAAAKEEKYLEAAFWYTILINCKHLYLYLAPAYFVYMLKNYCFRKHHSNGSVIWRSLCLKNLVKLSAIVVGVCFLSFAPFLLSGQIKHVLSQIFPVKRGLTHSYWAPNFWALYNSVDCVLVKLARYSTLRTGVSALTRGLVHEYEHEILPSVKLEATVILTLASIFPSLWTVWRKPRNPLLFVHCIIACAFGSFLFGYHVHEKAVLMIILPLTILVIIYPQMVGIFALLSSVGHFALFPLLYESAETPIKLIILMLHSAYTFSSLMNLHKLKTTFVAELLFFVGIPVIQAFHSFGMNIFQLNTKLPFLPLMMTSSYCAFCIMYCWARYYYMSLKLT